jgi:5-formyltetrahydrofolate cyclo-ligase
MSRITRDGHLHFHLVDSDEHLHAGSHGILEPDPEHCEPVDADDIDLLLVPGVGFDPKTFARLGRGKGHYDRFLEGLRQRFTAARLPAPVVLGVAYQCQLVDVPAEPHDQPMDGIVTDKAFLRTPQPGDS